MPFADLHCHPAFWAFNKRPDSLSFDWSNHHIWSVEYSGKDKKNLEKGKMANYKQADFENLSGGDVRLVFGALYPLEKGFFIGNERLFTDLANGLIDKTLNWPRWSRRLLGIVFSPINWVSKLLNSDGPARDLLQKKIMAFSKERINYLQDSEKYDYYREIEGEFSLYKTFENKKPKWPASPETLQYRMPSNGSEISGIIEQENKIAVVLTVEGFHALCLENVPGKKHSLQLVPEQEVLRRIDVLKNEWKVFFVTFSHHFTNMLAGHAHSLPLLMHEISNPVPDMNAGFVNPLAEKYIRRLLSIDAQNNTDTGLGRRVLIDVKHFSAASRKAYYKIVKAFNEKNDEKIPVIASHCGYYGPLNGKPCVTLQYQVENAHKEADDSFYNEFYRWNINLCDEDIEMVFLSGGLIGISFDQRILGVRNSNDQREWASTYTVAKNIIAMVSSVAQNPALAGFNPAGIWNCLCIGTDFDGLVDPVNFYPSSGRFGSLRENLVNILTNLEQPRKHALFIDGNPFSPAEVVDMFCFTNALQFAQKHFK